MKGSATAGESPSPAKASSLVIGGFPLPAIVFLALTAAVSLLWSHYKLLVPDELLVLQTDSVSSIGQIIHIQRAYPICLDPVFYHAVVHSAISLFGSSALVIRLPSLFGFLLMQVCLFVFVRRIASERAAIFALAFPALTLTLQYSAQARPYGLLLGLFALTMVSWQTAIRSERPSALALVALALSIAITLNTHYFGVLLLAPLCGAELLRTFQRRRLDIPVLVSIGVGMAGFIFVLPFMRAAAEFRQHYYAAGQSGLHLILVAYRWILVEPLEASARLPHLQAICLVLLAIPLSWACIRQFRSGTLLLANAEAAFLVLLAGLPFCWYLAGRYGAHSLELHFVLGTLVGISPLLAIALEPLMQSERAGKTVLVVLFAAITCAGTSRIHASRTVGQEFMSSLVVDPEIKAALMASPSQPIYFEELSRYEMARYYEPDPEVRSRMVLVYSRDQELYWNHSDTLALTAMHMRSFPVFPIIPYEWATAQPGSQLFVIDRKDPWDWSGRAIAASDADAKPLGSAFGGDLVSVRFHP
jgi:hypothetical protein